MGSGAVGFNIEPEQAVFADTNPHIIEFYSRVKEGLITPSNVRTFLEHEGKLLEQKDEAHYYQVRDRFNRDHDPLDFLFLNRACFNGMVRFNRDGEFNVPYGHKPCRFSKAYITKIVNQVAWVSGLLQRHSWGFFCQPFGITVAMATEKDFIYCDPPYIGRHTDYYGSWDEKSEEELHSALSGRGARYMLSTWDHSRFRSNGYIETFWNDCHKTTKEHFYHIGAAEANRNSIVEALLTNYDPGADLCI